MAVKEPGLESTRSGGCNNSIKRQNTQNRVLGEGRALESEGRGLGHSQQLCHSLVRPIKSLLLCEPRGPHLHSKNGYPSCLLPGMRHKRKTQQALELCGALRKGQLPYLSRLLHLSNSTNQESPGRTCLLCLWATTMICRFEWEGHESRARPAHLWRPYWKAPQAIVICRKDWWFSRGEESPTARMIEKTHSLLLLNE